MRDQPGTVGVQVPNRRHVFWFQLPAVDEEKLVARGRELLHDGAPDEPGAPEDEDPQDFVSASALALGEIGFLSTIRSIKPHSFACSGVMKKSRSSACSTSSTCRWQCLA